MAKRRADIVKWIWLIVGVLHPVVLLSGTGKTAYGWLMSEASAYQAAQGGRNVGLTGDGVSGLFVNPALVGDSTDGVGALTYNRYLSESGTNAGVLAYGREVKGEHFALGARYINYGEFDGYDEYGNGTGTFDAQDVALTLGWSRKMTEGLHVGVSLTPVFSHYEKYSSFGLMASAGARYEWVKHRVELSAVVQNVGAQLMTYEDERGRAPMNIAVTVGKGFEHAPIRLWMTWHSLNDWDFDYVSNGLTSAMGKNTKHDVKGWKLLAEHSVWGADLLLIGGKLRLSGSYNVRRAQELKLADGEKSLGGVSVGGGLKLKRVEVGVGAAQYQSGIWNWNFTVQVSGL